jgi:hypothetical protein
MKNTFKCIGIIVFITVIGFSLTVCGGGNDNGGGPYVPPVEPGPELTGTVSITGTAKVGETLTADITGLGGTGTVTYQWKQGTTSIGTNSNSYIAVEADIGSTITVTVKRAGYSGSITSDPTAAVVAAAPPELTGTVTISGTAIVGNTLTASTYSLNGSGTLTYQWKRGTADIGTNSSSYVIVDADVGSTITVTVTRAGYTGSKTSDPTAAVVRPYWTVVTNSTFASNDIIRSVVYGKNNFVAVGVEGKMAYSPDGKTWTAVTNTTFDGSLITSVAGGSSKLVAVGGQGKMAYSPDGITWTAVTTSTFTSAINSVATNLNSWVAAGNDGRMAQSTNGETWTAVADSKFGADNINCVATGMMHSGFVAVGASGKIAYSNSDGTSWTLVTNSTFGTTAINSVAYKGSNNFFVAVGNSGKMAYSEDDGVTWTAVTNSPFGTTAIRSVAWNGGYGNSGMFIAVGNEGKTAYSTDGKTWTAVTDGTFGYNDIYYVAFKGSTSITCVAVGSGGKIAYNTSE